MQNIFTLSSAKITTLGNLVSQGTFYQRDEIICFTQEFANVKSRGCFR